MSSKKRVMEQINRYKEVLKKVLDGQTEVSEETKQELLGELLANFEMAVQKNVLVNGLPWNEAPDTEEDVDLESQLDDAIVETSYRRYAYPKKILPHAVHALKAERELLRLYKNTVQPQVYKDPEQESLMNTLSAAAPGLVQQATEVMKSIQTLQKQAEGLCQILDMKPSAATLEIHREVFGHSDQSDALGPVRKRRQPIKRLVEEAAKANSYNPSCSVGD